MTKRPYLFSFAGAAFALALAAPPAFAQVAQEAVGAANAVAVAGAGTSGMPLGIGVAPSILNQSAECPAQGTSFGIGAPYMGFGFGRTHVEPSLENPCQARQWITLMAKLAVTYHSRGLEGWSVSVMCNRPELAKIAPAGLCRSQEEARPHWHWNSAYQAEQFGDTANFGQWVWVGTAWKWVTSDDPK